MATSIVSVWGVNEKNELVAAPGTGTNNVVGLISEHDVPVDELGRVVIAGIGSNMVVSSAAPNNADGRPDGTVYIQTA